MASEQKWKERLEQNIKLAIYGAGCTQDYAEKQTVALLGEIEQLQSEAIKKYNDEHTQDWLEEQVLEQAKAEARAEERKRIFKAMESFGISMPDGHVEEHYIITCKKWNKYFGNAKTPPRSNEVEQK